jgi:DNA-binding transcriptional LysR family regulator
MLAPRSASLPQSGASVDLRQLKYFVVLAEELHFRRAAVRLHITQAPLSLAIQGLERELGAQLFNRTRRRVELTASGKAFLVDAAAILKRVEQSRETIRDMAEGITGHLRVGITPASSMLPFFPKLIAGFRRERPHVRIVIREVHSEDQLPSLQAGEMDIGIIRNPPRRPPRELSVVKLLSDPLLLAMHRNHRLAAQATVGIAELRDETFINYPKASGTGIYQQVIRLCALKGFTPKVFQEVQEALTLLGLVAAGFGVALVPSGLSYVAIPNILFKPVADSGVTTEIHIASRVKDQDAAVEAFRRMALASLPRTRRGKRDEGDGH